MATQNDVRRIAMSLPDVTEGDDFRFFVGRKQFIWLWQERVDPKRPRVPNPRVIVVPVADDIAKRMLLAIDKNVFFTEPHYDGYNAVHVRLSKISGALLRKVVSEAWQARAAGTARRRSPQGPRPGSGPRRAP